MNLKKSKKGRKFLVALLFALVAVTAGAQQKSDSKMEWFENARLGIFIHWGIYSVNGIDESWSFFNGYIPYDEYMKQLNGFTTSSYDPEAWVMLIRQS